MISDHKVRDHGLQFLKKIKAQCDFGMDPRGEWG